MKITDIKPGTEYGALDKPSSRVRLPRQVRAVAIESVEQPVRSHDYLRNKNTRAVRHVRVEFLDDAQTESRWQWNLIANAKKGDSFVVEPRLLIAPWSELKDDVKKRINASQACNAAEIEMTLRIKAVLPKKWHDNFYVDARVDRNSCVNCQGSFPRHQGVRAHPRVRGGSVIVDIPNLNPADFKLGDQLSVSIETAFDHALSHSVGFVRIERVGVAVHDGATFSVDAPEPENVIVKIPTK